MPTAGYAIVAVGVALATPAHNGIVTIGARLIRTRDGPNAVQNAVQAAGADLSSHWARRLSTVWVATTATAKHQTLSWLGAPNRAAVERIAPAPVKVNPYGTASVSTAWDTW